MIIEPISELKNYNTLLEDVKDGSPIYLTKNGKGLYAIMTIGDAEDYEKFKINEEFKNKLMPNVSDMNFFVRDVETLNKKLKAGHEALKKNKKRYDFDETFDKLKREIRARKV